MPGLFISFEGTEGSGKSTQLARLARRLREAGRIILEVREPGGTPIGEEIRHTLKHSVAAAGMCPETELLLMNASRAQLVREVIRPALAANVIVLCDRFHDSSIAYQGCGRGIDLDRVRQIVDFAVGETRPDITLLLWLSEEESAARLSRRAASGDQPTDRFERAGREFFVRVCEGYRRLAREESGRVHMVDAMGSEEEVHARIWAIVEPRLGSV